MSDAPVRALSALGLLAGTALLLGAINKHGMFAVETASWVQAVGSVGAIAGAAWIAGQQSREARLREEREAGLAKRRREEAALATRASAAAMLTSVHSYIRMLAGFCQASTATDVNAYTLIAAQGACDALARFPLHILESLEAIEIFARCETVTIACLKHVKEQSAHIDAAKPQNKSKMLEGLAKDLTNTAEMLADDILTLRKI